MDEQLSTSQRGERFRLRDRCITPSANDIGGVRVDAKSMDVLMALAEVAPGVMSAADLLGRVWPNVVVVDNVVHQAIAQLRKALGDDARAPRFIESIPRRGYRLIVEVERVPSRLQTANGSGVPPRASTSRRPRPTLVMAAASALLAVASAWWFVLHRAPSVAEPPSILVLPFENLSDSQDANYFAAGVHEDVLARLSHIDGLKVISRTTALALANSHESIAEMATEAGVAHVMEGSIRRAGDHVRLTVQLIAVPKEHHVWSQTYDRQLADIFAVQDELAKSIAEQLRVRLDAKVLEGFAKAPTKNIEAYDLVLRASAMNPANREEVDTMAAYLDRAIALDPNYADAYGWRASAGFPVQVYGLDWQEVKPRALANIEKALSIDPGNVPALAAMAYYATREEHSQSAGLKYLARALSEAPGNALIHLMYGTRSNDYRERLQHWEEAYRLDPLDPKYSSAYVVGLLEQGRIDEAFAVAKRAVVRTPGIAGAVASLAEVYFAMGDDIAGLRELRRALEINPHDSAIATTYVIQLLTADLPGPAWRWIDAASAEAPESASSQAMRAWVLFLQNRTDELADLVATWPVQAHAGADALMFAALIEAHFADAAYDRGDPAARESHLTQALHEYDSLFAIFPDITTPGRHADTRTFPGDARLALLHYAALARQAGDAARATELAGHVARILSEQEAPESSPLARAMLAAFDGDRESAMREFERALVPGAWCVPILEAYGVVDDRGAGFHGILEEPRLQELMAAERSRRVELKETIRKEAPDLLEPGGIFDPS